MEYTRNDLILGVRVPGQRDGPMGFHLLRQLNQVGMHHHRIPREAVRTDGEIILHHHLGIFDTHHLHQVPPDIAHLHPNIHIVPRQGMQMNIVVFLHNGVEMGRRQGEMIHQSMARRCRRRVTNKT